MNVDYINPFVTSTISVFETMLGCKIQRSGLRTKDRREAEHEISGIIGLSGRVVGTVVVSLSAETAIGAAEAMLGERPSEIDDDVLDVVGELANMVAGGAKTQLEQYELNISLPNVITGVGHIINFPSKVPLICIDFDCPWGPLCVEVGFTEQLAAVATA